MPDPGTNGLALRFGTNVEEELVEVATGCGGAGSTLGLWAWEGCAVGMYAGGGGGSVVFCVIPTYGGGSGGAAALAMPPPGRGPIGSGVHTSSTS